MDMETSLSELVLMAIPPNGATWFAIRREVQGPSNEALEFCLKGLRTAKLILLCAKGDTGIWMRAETAYKPRRDDDKPPRTLTLTEVEQRRLNARKRWDARPPKYDKHGRRYCTARRHYVPVNQFGSGPAKDGLHAWCRSCKKLATRQARMANP